MFGTERLTLVQDNINQRQNMMVVHYARVSTFEQNIKRQLPDTDDRVYWDKCSGTVEFTDRQAGKELMQDAEAGHIEVIKVHSIDRLGRNTIDVLQTIKRFTELNVCIKSEKEGLQTLTDEGKENPVAQLLISVLSTLAEIDYKRRREAQQEGIALAKAEGKYTGRKEGTTIDDEDYLLKHADVNALLDRDVTIREIAKITEKSKTTVMNVKKAKQRIEAA